MADGDLLHHRFRYSAAPRGFIQLADRADALVYQRKSLKYDVSEVLLHGAGGTELSPAAALQLSRKLVYELPNVARYKKIWPAAVPILCEGVRTCVALLHWDPASADCQVRSSQKFPPAYFRALVNLHTPSLKFETRSETISLFIGHCPSFFAPYASLRPEQRSCDCARAGHSCSILGKY